MSFRLKINLEEFFSDERKLAYILIHPDWKYIKNVHEHIEKLFNIKNFCLVTEDSNCYLPVCENIEVIEKGEKLKVKKIWENYLTDEGVDLKILHKNKKSKKCSKYEEVGRTLQKNPNDQENNVKKSKKQNEKIQQLENNTIFKNPETNQISVENYFNLSTEEANTNPTPIKTSKRKRKRKKEKVSPNISPCNDIPKTELIKSDIDKIQNHVKSQNHIRFDMNGEIIEKKDNKISECKENKNKVIFKSYINENSKPRIIKAIVFENIDSTTETNSNNKNLNNSLKELDHSLTNGFNSDENTIGNKSTDDLQNVNVLNQSEIILENENEKLNMEKELENESNSTNINAEVVGPKSLTDYLSCSKPLDASPAIFDILLFKICKLNENYEPGFSEYICAKVEGFNEETNDINLRIIEGHNEFEETKGKFYMATNEFENEEETEVVNLNLENMKFIHKLNNIQD